MNLSDRAEERPVNLSDLARVHDDDLRHEAAGDPSGPGARALLDAIMSEPPARRRSRRPVLLRTSGVAAGLAAAAVAITVAWPSTPVARPAEPTARQVLLAAATAAMREPATGDYWLYSTISGMDAASPDNRYIVTTRTSAEMWVARQPGARSRQMQQYLGTKPATAEDEAAWRAAGSPRIWKYPPHLVERAGPVPGQVLRAAAGKARSWPMRGWANTGGALLGKFLTWKEILAMPADEAGLRAYLGRRAKEAVVLQGACLQIIFNLPVSPATRASAYRILASLPGITSLGNVRDPLGRTGLGLGYQAHGNNRMFDIVQVIDPATGMPLARWDSTAIELADGRKATSRAWTAYRRVGWTDDKPPS